MAILRLTLTASYFQQTVINRWFYIGTGTPASVSLSFGLASAFGGAIQSPATLPAPGTVLDGILFMQTDDVLYQNCLVEDLYTPDNFYDSPLPSTVKGSIGGVLSASPTMAMGFRTSRVTSAIRRGMKRFVGLAQGNIADGGSIEPTTFSKMTTLATLMKDPLTYDDEGNTLTYTPAILSFEEYTTPKGNKAYRPYADEATQLANSFTGFSWEPYDTVRTQNSRQYGRGR